MIVRSSGDNSLKAELSLELDNDTSAASSQRMNVVALDVDVVVVAGADDTEVLVPSCPNICCTGAFIQEAMMGVVMSAEVSIIVITVIMIIMLIMI